MFRISKIIKIPTISRILASVIICLMLLSLMAASSCELDISTLMNQDNMEDTDEDSSTLFPETIVISDPEDPYYPLAGNIVSTENAILVDSVEELYDYYPQYLIWVASPDFLSENKLLDLGKYFKQTQRFAAAGIITGATMESAGDLWERAKLAREGRNYIASDIDINGGIENGVIIDVSAQSFSENALNKENLIDALKNADYFYWARHVSDDGWFWHKGPKGEEYEYLYPHDIQDLKPVIIHTPSCGSFFPWVENSIALGFIEKGASVYLGNLFSPLTSGIFIGHLNYLPGEFTWVDFPIGIMAQIQNKSTSRICTNIPIFFMMGNPKISLQNTKPYEIISDQVYKNKRIIKGRWENAGILPLKIEDGASYSFVSIRNLSAISDNDLFYNSKIQSVNIQSDKYLLFIAEDAEFEIELSKKSPFLWNWYDSIKDSFEYSWITIGVVEGYISLAFLGLFLLIFLIYKIKKKIPVRTYLPAIISGLVIAALQLIFMILQTDKVTASSYLKTYPVLNLILGFIGTFSTVSGGLILMVAARKKILKALGMIVCVLPQLMLTIFYTLMIFVTNLQFAALDFPSLWNYSIVYQFLIVLIIEVMVFTGIYFLSLFFISSVNQQHYSSKKDRQNSKKYCSND